MEIHRRPICDPHLDWSHCHGEVIVKLQPKCPPGRADRKAGAYSSEIVQLRCEGYTYRSIREALAELGITLSDSALRREVRRQQKTLVHAMPGVRSPSPVPDIPTLPELKILPTGAPPSRGATGHEIAEAFFDAHPGNPLLSTKETS